ncbi:MAG: tetratricopeptide repeat protein, partial [Phycisphaerae bacterium]
VVRCADFVRRQDWLAIGGCVVIVFLLHRGINRGWPEELRRRDVARAYTQLGAAYAAAGRDDEARQALRDSLAADPNSIEALAGLGYNQFQQGRYAEAAEHFRAALRLSPGIDVHEMLARSLIKLDRWGEGIDVLRSGTEDLPHYLDMKRMLAFILATCPDARHRDGREAVRLAEMVRDFGPEIPETFDTLACAYARVGRYEDALRSARKALEIAQRVLQLEALEQINLHIRQFERRRPFTQFEQVPGAW